MARKDEEKRKAHRKEVLDEADQWLDELAEALGEKEVTNEDRSIRVESKENPVPQTVYAKGLRKLREAPKKVRDEIARKERDIEVK